MKYSKGSFIVVPNKEVLDGVFTNLQVVFMWLCSYADEDGICFPSRATLARNTGCSVKTIDRAIESLCEAGLLKKTTRSSGGKNLTNLYQIMLLDRSGDSQSLRGVRESLGVASESRTELNPVLTQSTYSSANAEIRVSEDVIPRKESTAKYPHALEVFALWGAYPKNWTSLKNSVQREAAENLYEEQGIEEIKAALEYIEKHKSEDFFPQIATPHDLDSKWAKLAAFYDKKHA